MLTTHKEITILEKQFGDAFYIFKTTHFKQNIIEFKYAFERFYGNTIIGYSYKTNYIPYACKIANDLGVFSEIVSEMELEITKKLKIDIKSIIYNGPIKSESSLNFCLNNGAIVNIDNLSELDIIKRIVDSNPNTKYKIGIRLNLNLNDNFISRFGFDVNSSEFKTALNIISSIKNLTLNGFHSHSTRPDKSVESYLKRLNLMIEFADIYIKKDELEYLDIGGGYFGKMDSNIKQQFNLSHLPTFAEYGEALGKRMKEQFPKENVKLIIEPGLALTVNILDFVCKVKDIKTINNQKIATCTGSFHNVKPSGHSRNLTMHVLSKEMSNSKNMESYDICGYTCLENDIIYNKYNGHLYDDDYLIFRNVGAYTIVFKPPFIKLAPPIIAIDNNIVTIIRKEEKLDDIFKAYTF